MNKIRRIVILIALAVPIITMLGSCNKFLDRKPLTSTLDDLNQGGLEGQIFGLYSFFRSSYGNVSSLPYIGLHGFRSDDAVKGSEQSDGAEWAAPMDQFKYDKSFPGATSYWDDHYKLINFANTALQTADSLKLTSDADMINLAEARFFRAFAYFDLVRTFGEVPKIDFRIYEASQANVAKSSVADIYALIDADLQFAASTLPVSWGSKFLGRLTSGAAKALHAKAYIFRGNFPLTLALTQQIIASGQYALFTPYWKIFKDEGENSSESILEVQNEVTAVDDYGTNYATSQNVRASTASGWNLGWGWNTPTESLVNAYEAGDPRKDATILFAGQSDDPANGGYGRTLPKAQVDGGILFSRYFNKKVYADPAKRLALNRLDQAGWINQRLIRYSNVILMAAEAANELGDGALAETLVEQVRARARNGANVLPKIVFASKQQMRDAIKHERRVEFGMEEERFYDLVRWGDAVTVLGPLGYTDKNKYYPIPQSFIDKSGGVLKQNPDYP
jgi:hypothetical protein